MRTKVTAGASLLAAAALLSTCLAAAAQQQPAQGQGAQPALDTWGDNFDGERLDESNWELYTFEGAGGKAEVKGGQLRLRGAGDSRAGVRSKKSFGGDRFYAEATLAKVSERAPRPGEQGMQLGTAILTVLFDGKPENRIEWLLRSDGRFEAWVGVDGRMERVDKNNLGTKEKTPRLAIARRGEKIFFMLNGQVGLEHTLRRTWPSFRVMLYGFGTSENNWDSVVVQTLKQ
jgi:hypothetical protein